MNKLFYALFSMLLMPAIGHAQVGQLSPGQILGNPSAARTPAATPTTISAILDRASCSAQGSVLYRSATDWICLAPGTAGHLLRSGGAGQDIGWSNDIGVAIGTSLDLSGTLDVAGNVTFTATTSASDPTSGALRVTGGVGVGGAIYADGLVSSNSHLYAGASSVIAWLGRARLASPVDGVVTLLNATANGFDRLQFGGATAAQPALKRNGAVLAVRLADDSADAGLSASAATLSGLTGARLVASDAGKTLVSSISSANLRLSVTDPTGTGSLVFADNPALTGATLTGSTINKVTITAPATGATLTIPDGVTLTGPAASGTAMTLGNAETVTGVKSFNVGTLVLNGATSGSTVVNAAATASGTLTLPAATDTLVGRATTDTLSNKTLVAPVLGAATATSINGLTITASTGTLTIANGKTLTANNSITLAGTDGTTWTGPATSATLAALNVASQTVSGGANVTAQALTAGNITVDCGTRPIQTIANNGAFTMTAPANDGYCVVKVTNGASAGAITFSGFSTGANTGDALTTVNGSKFMIFVYRAGGDSTYSVKALQ